MSKLFTAFCDYNDAFSPEAHSREDLAVFDASLALREGEAAQLTLEVKRTPAIQTGKWLFVSYGGIPLMKGVITSYIGLYEDTVTLDIVARPNEGALQDLAPELRTPPFYNHISMPKENRDDVNELLAGHTKVIEWDPITHTPKLVSIFGPMTQPIQVIPFEGTLDRGFVMPPAGVRLKATAEWEQSVVYEDEVVSGRPEVSGLLTMSAEDLVNSWPKKGDEVGGEMTVLSSVAAERSSIDGTPWRKLVTSNMRTGRLKAPNGTIIDLSDDEDFTFGWDDRFDLGGPDDEEQPPAEEPPAEEPPAEEPPAEEPPAEEPGSGKEGEKPNPALWEVDPSWEQEGEPVSGFISQVDLKLQVQFKYEVKRSETFSCVVPMVLQQGVPMGDIEDLEIPVQDFSEVVNDVPKWKHMQPHALNDVVDFRSNMYRCIEPHTSTVFFQYDKWERLGLTERAKSRRLRAFFGGDSFGTAFKEYMLQRARQRLSHAARCLTFTCEAKLPEDPSTVRTDRRAAIFGSGLSAFGKITEATLFWKENGESGMSITISCAPGLNNEDTAVLDIEPYFPKSERATVSIKVENRIEKQLKEFSKMSKKEKVKYASEIQKPRFTNQEEDKKQSRSVPATKIEIEANPPEDDLAVNVSGAISGAIAFPQQVLVQ